MDAKELMIGDWVIFGDEPLKVQHIYNNGYDDVVAEIVEEGTNEYGVYEEIKDVPSVYCSPIPITPEILEKNGIKKRRDEYAVFGWEGMKQWYVTLEDFKPQYDFWFITSSDRDLNISGKIRYVHQLQHALRLCGLNEIADNFKV